MEDAENLKVLNITICIIITKLLEYKQMKFFLGKLTSSTVGKPLNTVYMTKELAILFKMLVQTRTGY